jgi:hypothetical protein
VRDGDELAAGANCVKSVLGWILFVVEMQDEGRLRVGAGQLSQNRYEPNEEDL